LKKKRVHALGERMNALDWVVHALDDGIDALIFLHDRFR